MWARAHKHRLAFAFQTGALMSPRWNPVSMRSLCNTWETWYLPTWSVVLMVGMRTSQPYHNSTYVVALLLCGCTGLFHCRESVLGEAGTKNAQQQELVVSTVKQQCRIQQNRGTMFTYCSKIQYVES